MKILETLSAIEQSDRGGSYYEKGSLFEGILLGLGFGFVASIFHYINKPFGIALFVVILSVIMLAPNKFKGFRRCIIFRVANIDVRYSTIVFSLFYFLLVGGTAAIVLLFVKKYLGVS